MAEGWIKLHRKIQNHWLWDDPDYLKAWLTILLTVNHEENKILIHGELMVCGRGQSLNSLQSWSRLLGKKWSIQRVRTFFKLLSIDNMLTLEGLQKTTRLTVCNYDGYQDVQQTDNRQITDSQHADNRQTTTNKNEENVKKVKNEKNNKDKESKSIAAKAATLSRKKDFYNSLVSFSDKYTKDLLRSFFDYWSELNPSQTKMRFEQQPTWEVSKRLATWKNKEKPNGNIATQGGKGNSSNTPRNDAANRRAGVEDLKDLAAEILRNATPQENQ